MSSGHMDLNSSQNICENNEELNGMSQFLKKENNFLDKTMNLFESTTIN
jgi:hypothetical protein